MFSLRAILLAAAACAMIASAIPMPGHDEAPGPEPILDSVLGNFGDIGGVLGHDIFPAETTDEAIKAAGGHVRRGDLYNPSDSFQKCSSGIALVIVKISSFFFPLHLYTNKPSNSFKSESACGGDSSKVDHNVVIGLLREILALLGTLLFELKGGDYKGCDVNVLSGLLSGLLIVRFSIDPFFWLISDVSSLGSCRSHCSRYRGCWFP